MMNNRPEYRGARFYKCALQVNPCGYGEKYRGVEPRDEKSYNRQILEECRKNEIEVVGLADHGSIDSSKTLRIYLTENSIVVFPGFEIPSSEKIHMVCLYPENTTDAQLNQFLGQLMGGNSTQLKDNPTHPSSLSCEEMANIILKRQEGFWYAAHATGKNGLLKLSGGGDNYVHLWKKDDLVVAGQIPGSVEDLGERYRQIIDNQNPDYRREKGITIINAKDICDPEHLSDPSASCQIKMTVANFQAFRDAFKDPQSRIRLNHEMVKYPISRIESIRWRGAGLFENQELTLSPNLNAVIGGRGAGKSTLIESIRFVLDLQPRGDDSNSSHGIQSSNLKNSQVELTVRSGAQYGECYIISRRFHERPVVKNRDGEISQIPPRDLLPGIELLGQNEILAIERSEIDKLALLKTFLPDIRGFSDRIDEAKRKLSENRKRTIAAQDNLDIIEQKIKRESILTEQKQQYKKLGIEEKLKNSTLLGRESQIEERIIDQLRRISEWLRQYEDLFDLTFLQDASVGGLPNKKPISEIRALLERLKTSLDDLVNRATQTLENTASGYQSKQRDWKKASDGIRDQINQAIAQLPDQEGKSGREIGANYQEIIAELTSLERYKEEYARQKQLIGVLESERRSLSEEYRNMAFERYTVMAQRIAELNKNELRGKIKISLSQGTNLADLKEFMQKLDGIGPAKIKWLDEIEAPIDLGEWSQWIRDGSKDRFKEKYQGFGLADSTVERLIAINPEQRLKLEEIELKDTLSIELNIAHESEPEEKYRPLKDLSIGQKCTTILNLLLIKKDDPLIIDQPEDHLDNAFIAERIVSELRDLKTQRQFLFATHNANIPVFGDAELIAVLESKESKAVLAHIGSIDDQTIRDQAAQILEGGKSAFDMRKEKYGF